MVRDGIVFKDEDGQVIFNQHSFCELVKHLLVELVGISYPDIFRQLVQLLQSQIHPLERKIFPQIRPQGLHPSEFRHIEAVHSQKLSGALQLLKGRRQSDLRCFALYTNRAGVFHPYPENAVQSLVLQKFRCLFLHIIAAGIFSSMLFPIFSPHTGIIDIGLEAIRKWCDPFVHKVDAQF